MSQAEEETHAQGHKDVSSVPNDAESEQPESKQNVAAVSNEHAESVPRADENQSPSKMSDLNGSPASRSTHMRPRSRSHTPVSGHSGRRHRPDYDDYEREHKRRRSRTPPGDRERVADRDRERDREYRRSQRERERERDREREREYDRERERRHRERDRERYYSDRDRDRDYDRYYRDRDRDRDRRRRDRYEGERSYDRPRRRDTDERPKPRKAPSRSPSPKLTEEEHEMRSVFVSQLSARVGDRELAQFFTVHGGPVREARVIVDRMSRRSKGVGYVEFREQDTVSKALSLTGTNLLGIPIRVEYTEAEKNRQAASGEVKAAAAAPQPLPTRIYVGSLNFSLSDADVSAVFRPFGEIDFVDLHRDSETGKSKGYCFIQFKNAADAQTALEKMNGFQLAGRPIKVNLVNEKANVNATGQPADQTVNQQNAAFGNVLQAPQTNYFGSGSTGTELGEGIGGMNNNTRMDLMQKLARTQDADTVKAPLYRPNIPIATSKCILLKNMFNAAEETEPDFDTELQEDVKDEVQSKYGPVNEIFVIKDSSEGEIYIKLEDLETSAKTLSGLNGRWFGGRQISVIYVSDAIMSANKPR